MQRGILLFGYPGSGKGTQGRLLGSLPGFHHVAMGDILRSLSPDNPMLERVQSYIRRGELVPDDLVMDLFFGYIESIHPAHEDFLVIDGVPRSARQVELLNQKVQVIKIFKLSVYDERLVIDRLRRRARDQNRPDDASDPVILRRLEVYRQETESCTKAYAGQILTRIQANQPIFDVHLDIIQALGKIRNIQFR
jgi:adenylate kinase